jgi:uncharacterized alkaline shock family protein YloU
MIAPPWLYSGIFKSATKSQHAYYIRGIWKKQLFFEIISETFYNLLECKILIVFSQKTIIIISYYVIDMMDFFCGGIYMQGQMETEFGKIVIDSDVIATYAGSVAVECFGIVGMAAVNMKDGLVKLLKKDYLNHGIKVEIDDDNEISLDFHVIVSYGVGIETVSDNLMETVKYKVESFTGMKVKEMNIYVEGVRVID